MDAVPRLDVLLYAHDGRGLGHASRTIAIGMALRRLAPDLRVLFLSGCNLSQELIGEAPLDWLKLPSYETVVESGRSRGVKGKSNFADNELGRLRSKQILNIVKTYRPRLILADHSPQGKHKELLPALQADAAEIHWVLGLRGIVGQVSQVSSQLATSLFIKHYTSLLWYGDSTILGTAQLTEIRKNFNTVPVECGYVSGIRERSEDFSFCGEKLAGTVSVPWIGEKTPTFLRHLHAVLAEMGDTAGRWILYLDASHPRSAEFYTLFQQLPWCDVEEPSRRYITSLRHSRCALIYGGYNSLVDVLSLSLPALVILRDMLDSEQQQHLDILKHTPGISLTTLPEDTGEDRLAEILHNLPHHQSSSRNLVNLDGAVNAAKHLLALLGQVPVNSSPAKT